MIFLPIVDRELRVAARQHRTHAIRLWIALAVMVIGAFFFIATPGMASQEVARRIFQSISGFAMLYCLAAGRLLTADCISSEKRDGTLGLLFLTDLKGYDVIGGKLAATSFRAFYGLLAIFPVLAVPLLMGGVSHGEFWRTVLALVNAFLFSLAIGIFVSVLCQDARRAMGANFLFLVLLAGLPASCAGAVAFFTSGGVIVYELFYSCPVYPLVLATTPVFRVEAAHFWWSVGVIHGLAWLLVGLASFLVPRSWQDLPPERARIPWRERWRRLVYGKPARRESLRKRLLNVNAFYWLASRAWFKPIGVWLALAFVVGWWLFVLLQLQFSWSEEAFVVLTLFLLNTLLKLWIAVETSQRLAEDQSLGALELLLSTPLTARDILAGQLLALRRQFLWPLVAVLLAEIVLTVSAARQSTQQNFGLLSVGLSGMCLLLADSCALVWVAMATALTARSPNRASLSTITRVLIVPLVAYGALAILAGAWSVMLRIQGPGWKFYLYSWLWLGILADIGFGLPAWWQLRTGFRQLALRRFAGAHARSGN